MLARKVNNTMNDLLKFITCGSVDDGKSTLIGHILYDSKLLYADQEKALELDSKVGSRGGKIDYSLLLDGLTEEREQGITIDVAYRYFTTDKRSFIVADTPGHEEYTRNMAVGASFADLAVILVDASQGVLVQTRRHSRIAELMGIRYFVFAVNKMDLVDYSEECFNEIKQSLKELSDELGLAHVIAIPVSATEGDNVTRRSEKMPWYDGPVLLDYLENVQIDHGENEEGFYMPVQRVCRPDHTFRGFEGGIEAGKVSVGDEITVYPSLEKARVKGILKAAKESDSASIGAPVTLTLDREIDVSRGSVIARDTNLPLSDMVEVSVLWMDDEELTKGKNFFVKLGTRQIPGLVTDILYKVDVNTGEHKPAETLKKNEIARVVVAFTEKIVVDEFDKHKTLGEMILIDRISYMTSACGVVEKVLDSRSVLDGKVTPEIRAQLLGQTPAAFVLADASENLSDSDAQKVEKKLLGNGKHVLLISDSEATVAVLTALNNAGIIALVSGKADLAGYDKYKKLESADSDLTGSALIESIADQIDKATNL